MSTPTTTTYPPKIAKDTPELAPLTTAAAMTPASEPTPAPSPRPHPIWRRYKTPLLIVAALIAAVATALLAYRGSPAEPVGFEEAAQ